MVAVMRQPGLQVMGATRGLDPDVRAIADVSSPVAYRHQQLTEGEGT